MNANESMHIINLDSGVDKSSPKISQFTHNADCIKFITKRDLTNFCVSLISSIENSVSLTTEGDKLIKTFNEDNGETEILWYPSSEITALSGCVIYQIAAYNAQNNDEVWYSCEGRLIVSDSIDTTDYSAELIGGNPNLLMQILTLTKAIELNTKTLETAKVDKTEGMGLSQNSFTDIHKKNLEDVTIEMQKLIANAPENLNTVKKLAEALGNNPHFADDVIADLNAYIAKAEGAAVTVEAHKYDLSNPHRVTSGDVGLGKVDNTSDEDKPLSKAAREALDTKFDKTEAEAVIPTKIDKAAIVTDYEDRFAQGDYDNYVPSFGLYSGFCENSVHFLRDDKDILYEIPDNIDPIAHWRSVVSPSAVKDYVQSQLHPVPIESVPVTLEANKEYNFGWVSSLSLSFPTIANNGDVIYLTFFAEDTSDAMQPNLIIDTTNTCDIELIPEQSTGYEIFAKYNGEIWIVNYSEYIKVW